MKLYFALLTTTIVITACTSSKPITQNTKQSNTQLTEQQKIEQRDELELLKVRNPKTGFPEPYKLISAFETYKTKQRHAAQLRTDTAIQGINWTERGPWQVGGRTRSVVWDKNDPTKRKIWAGSVSGGLWYCENIFSNTPNWHKVDDLMDNLSITSIIYDPFNSNIMYFGTGERVSSFGGNLRGLGLYKSIDGGNTWAPHPALNNQQLGYVQKILIDSSGNLYAASSWNGLVMYNTSTNNWQTVLDIETNATVAYDVEIDGRGNIYTSLQRIDTIAEPKVFYKKYFNTSGQYATNWTELTNLSLPSNSTRIEIVPNAKKGEDGVYLLTANRTNGSCHSIKKVNFSNNLYFTDDLGVPTIQDGGNGGVNFARDQASYDLTGAVPLGNVEYFIVGGISHSKYTLNQGHYSWVQSSWWTGGASQTNCHADQHDIVFFPGSSDTALIANDGGVYITTNLSNHTPAYQDRNDGYRVTQFYHAANTHDNENYLLGGTQDNGTWRFTASTGQYPTSATGGDGAYCHIDHTDFNLQIGAYIYNNYRVSTDGGASFTGHNFKASNGEDRGLFINPTIFERYSRKLFGAWSVDSIMRYDDVATKGPNWTKLRVSGMDSGYCTHINNAPADNKDNLFVGTNKGRVLKLKDVGGTIQTTFEVLMQDSVPNGWVSCIAQDYSNANHLLVTFSNYGVKSIWETKNKGISWRCVEGNLPDMPVRWCLFHPDDPKRALIATEIGVWSTDNLDSDTVDWQPNNTTLANVRVDALRLGFENKYEYDNFYQSNSLNVVAATHGRGLYTTNLPKIPNIYFTSNTLQLPEKTTIDNGCEKYTDYKMYVGMSIPFSNDLRIAVDTLPGFTAKKGKDFDLFVNGNQTNEILFDAGTNYAREFTVRIYNDALINPGRKFALKLRLMTNTKAAIIRAMASTDTVDIVDNDAEPDFNETIKLVTLSPGSSEINNATPTPFSHGTKVTHVEYRWDSTFLLQAGLKPNVPISAFTLQSNHAPAYTVQPFHTARYGVYTSGFYGTDWPFILGTASQDLSNYTPGTDTSNYPISFTWRRDENLFINMYVNNNHCPDPNQGAVTLEGYSTTPGSSQNQTMYRIGNDDFNCGTPFNSSVNIATYSPLISFKQNYYIEAAKGTLDSAIEKLGPFETVYFKSSPTVLLAKVENLSSHNYGCVKVQIDRQGDTIQPFWNNNLANSLLAKTWRIIPTNNNPSGNYRITVYFSPEEARAWMTETGLPWSAIQLVKTPTAVSSINPSNVPSGIIVQNNILADSIGSGNGLTYRVTAEFSTGFSGFGAGVPGYNPLPLRWLNLKATVQDQTIDIEWQTANEINTLSFDIEKSTDGSTFKTIGTIPSKNSSINDYLFIDRNPIQGINYYRIKQKDKDGKITYSTVVKIKWQLLSNLMVYPNPAKNELNINSGNRMINFINIINASGNKVWRRTGLNQNRITIPITKLPNGTYRLQLQFHDGSQSITSFVKQ
jgi:hypothetical protein